MILITGCWGNKITVCPVCPPCSFYFAPPVAEPLAKLDTTKDICSTENIQILLNNLNYLTDYSARLEEINKAWDSTCKGTPYTPPTWLKIEAPKVDAPKAVAPTVVVPKADVTPPATDTEKPRATQKFFDILKGKK